MKNSIDNYLSGDRVDSRKTIELLSNDILPKAIDHISKTTLPCEFSLYDNDLIPMNQRNLTDVRTRMGALLEYELAKAISFVLPKSSKSYYALNYVIAHKYPDLAFRTNKGKNGVRLEVKTIQTIAEEKAANFDTLVKDIRKGYDYVVVMLWEWTRHKTLPKRYPEIDALFVFDAYHLAIMRDCYWLNHPPSVVRAARQGFDLNYAVNCNLGNYNIEEGNYGKLMRIFSKDYEVYLPKEVREGETLKYYYKLVEASLRLGLEHILIDIMNELPGADIKYLSKGLPITLICKNSNITILIIGGDSMPSKEETIRLMRKHKIKLVMTLNGKYDWRVRDEEWKEIERGNKPSEAKEWIRRFK
jgi:hypothetical protein